jgi:hypothetical protein
MQFGSVRIYVQADAAPALRLASGFGPGRPEAVVGQERLEEPLSIGCQVAAWDPGHYIGGKIP